MLRWLRANPGHHRCVEIAQGTGLETHPVAIACYALATKRDGEVVRGEREAANGRRPFNTYGATVQAAENRST